MLPKINNPWEKTIDNLDQDVLLYIDYVKDKFNKELKNVWFLNNSWSILRVLWARDFDINKVIKLF